MLNITERFAFIRSLPTAVMCLSLTACIAVPDNPEPAETSQPAPAVAPAVELSPQESLARRLQQSIDHYQQNKKSFLPDQQTVFNRAIDLFATGEAKQAESVLVSIINAPGIPSAAWVLQGDIAAQQGDTSAAISAYHTAITSNPFNYFALNRLGYQYREKGQFDTANDFYKQAINAWPGYASAYYNAGILNDLYLGDRPAAIEHYQQYLALAKYPQNGNVNEKLIRQVERWIADVEQQQRAAVRERGQ